VLTSDPRESLVLPELVGSMALVADLAMGHPLEQGLGACLVAGRVGELVGLRPDERDRVFYLTLLRHIGCTTESASVARWFGDEIRLAGELTAMTGSSTNEYLWAIGKFAVTGRSPVGAGRALGRAAAGLRGLPALTRAICEVATTLAGRMGLGERVAAEIGMVYERWDGKGMPRGCAGETIPLTVRVAQVADLLAATHDLGHPDPGAVLAERAGTAFDPAVVEVVRRHEVELRGELDSPSRWDAVQRRRPVTAPMSGAELDDALGAVADFVDLKSPHLSGHSSGVAALAARAAEGLRLTPADVTDIRHAALVHDLGRVAVSSAVWDKPGQLSAGEWEAVRLHPYHTERLLGRAPFLARLAPLAGAHHERLDGSGYFRSGGLPGVGAQVLAAADAYHAMREVRPHRPALDARTAASTLRAEARSGRLAGTAVEAVLTAAGHPARARTRHAAGLTDRELQVLRLIALGRSNREVARELAIAPKTAGNHIQSIYEKAGVGSRAAATLFAMQHGLVDPLRS